MRSSKFNFYGEKKHNDIENYIWFIFQFSACGWPSCTRTTRSKSQTFTTGLKSNSWSDVDFSHLQQWWTEHHNLECRRPDNHLRLREGHPEAGPQQQKVTTGKAQSSAHHHVPFCQVWGRPHPLHPKQGACCAREHQGEWYHQVQEKDSWVYKEWFRMV